jgi:cytochrome c biogenesis protein CcdA
MTVGRIINMMAGMMVMFSVLLAHMAGTVDITEANWLWLALFVGFNLFQFSFTGFCPMDIILRKMGVKTDAQAAAGSCGSGGCGSN